MDKHPEKKNKIKIEKRTNDAREQEWLKKNKEVIEKQNDRMEREGSFSNEHRRL